jgi:hypothetical protein
VRLPGRFAAFSTAATIVFVAATPHSALAAPGRSARSPARSASTSGLPCPPAVRFNRADFPDGAKITNQYLPLVPGTQYVLEGRANRGGGPLPHTVIFTVTDLTKVINGVKTRVIWDRDINEDVLSEEELAFEAQDDDGNVWNMGEYPEEFEDGEFTGAPNTWIAGLAGARAGLSMPARPQVGTPEYLQGFAPEIDFLDCAKVIQKGGAVTVPSGRYHHILVTDERSPLDPASGHQRKFHAPGVGIVQVGAVDDPEGETLVLVDIIKLDARGLAEARAAGKRLDRRGHRNSEVYRQTAPVERG